MDPGSPTPPRRGRRALLSVAIAGLGGALLLLAVSQLGRVRTFDIGSNTAMFPALEPGDWILVRREPFERGAVVAMRSPNPSQREALVKRVVALGGDTIALRQGRLILNGAEVPGEDAGVARIRYRNPDGGWTDGECTLRTETLGDTTYRTACTPGQPCGEDLPALRLPPGTVFVLGDHRDHSMDSRFFGPVSEQLVLGRVKRVYFSLGPEGVRWERIGASVR
jgi:signal peptidase I